MIRSSNDNVITWSDAEEYQVIRNVYSLHRGFHLTWWMKVVRCRLQLGCVAARALLKARIHGAREAVAGQGDCTVYSRLLSSWPLGKILTGPVHYRVTWDTLSGYPESWSSKTGGSSFPHHCVPLCSRLKCSESTYTWSKRGSCRLKWEYSVRLTQFMFHHNLCSITISQSASKDKKIKLLYRLRFYKILWPFPHHPIFAGVYHLALWVFFYVVSSPVGLLFHSVLCQGDTNTP